MPDLVNILKDGLKARFFDVFENQPRMSWELIASRVDSSPGRENEEFGWLGALQMPKEWIDERDVKRLDEYTYNIPIKTYENTIAVKRTEIDADQYGRVKARVDDMAQRAAQLYEKMVFTALAAGFTATGFDGATFFSTTHPRTSGGTQSNRGTTALSQSALETARAAMLKFTDDKGEPMGIIPDTLAVPPELEKTALELVVSPVQVSTSASSDFANVRQGSYQVVTSPYLTDANDWFLLDTKSAVKSIVVVEADPIEFSSLDNPSNNEEAFMRDRFLYGTRQRFGVGYGPWWTAYGSIV